MAEGETIAVELDQRTLESGRWRFHPSDGHGLGKDVALGKEVKATVSAEVVAEDAQADKVTSIRYKASSARTLCVVTAAPDAPQNHQD